MKTIFTKAFAKALLPFGLSLLGFEINRTFLNPLGLPDLFAKSFVRSGVDDYPSKLRNIEEFSKPIESVPFEAAKLTDWISSEGFTSYFWFMMITMTLEIIISALCLINKCSYKDLRQALTCLRCSSSGGTFQNLYNVPQTIISEFKKLIMYAAKMTILYSLYYLLYLVIFLVVYFIFADSGLEQLNSAQQGNFLIDLRSRNLQSSGEIDPNQPLLNFTLTPTSSPIIQGIFETGSPAFQDPSPALLISQDKSTMFFASGLDYAGIKVEIYNISAKTSVTYLGGLYLLDSYFNGVSYSVSLVLSSDEQTLFLVTDWILQVFNVSDLTSPQNISSFSSPTNSSFDSTSMLYYDEKIFVTVNTFSGTGGVNGVQIIDVSNMSAPTEALFISGPSDFSLSSDGNTLFLLSGTYPNIYIQLLNITDINSPQNITSVPCPSDNWWFPIDTYEDTMYLWDSDFDLEIWDISNLANPNPVASLNFSNFGQIREINVAFAPNYETVYVVNGTTFQILNASDYSFSPISEQISIPGATNPTLLISPDGRHIFFDTSYGFAAFDVSDPSSPISLPQIYLAQIGPPVGFQEEVDSYVFSADGQTLFVRINNDYVIIQFYMNLQASQALNFLGNTIGTIDFEFESYDVYSLAASVNNSILYLACRSCGSIKVINVSDLNNPIWLPPIDMTLSSITISSDGNYLFGISISSLNDTFVIYDLWKAQVACNYSINTLASFALSQDNSTAILYDYYHSVFVLLNISNPYNASNTGSIFLNTSQWLTSQAQLSNNGQIAFLSGYSYLEILNISTPSSPQLIFNESAPWTNQITNLALSSDDNTLFTLFCQNDVLSLGIINVSILATPTFIASLSLSVSCQDIVVSFVLTPMQPSGEVIFLALNDGVSIAIDVSVRTLPTVVSSYQMETNAITASSDHSTLFLLNDSDILIVSLKPQNLLFLDSNQWTLGAPYPTAMNVLTKNSNDTYDVMVNYKFTDLSLYTPSLTFTTGGYTALPNWITFDMSTGYIGFSSNSQASLGSHLLCGAFSTQMTNSTFIGTASISNTNDSVSLLITLIMLGYVDNEFYLTPSFNPNQPMVLTFPYANNETEIRQTLANYYVEAFTSIYVTPSLSIVLPDPSSNSSISIDTLSQEPLDIMITIGSNSSQPKFVSSGLPLTAMFSSDYSTISMVRSLLEVNTALSQIIIYLNGSESCYGNITIIDGLNPTLYQYVPNIAVYFRNSSQPYINTIGFQSQLAQITPKTGQQFVIQFDTSTFTDPNNEPLTLSLEMQDSSLQVPDWLNLKGLTLLGTPPEQLTGRDLSFKIIVSNQYQSSEIDFALHVSISLEYFLTIAVKYVGYLITAIGVLIYAVDIYNIVGKRFYTYSKDFIIRPDQEIDPKVLYPIVFAKDPLIESKLIIHHLDMTIAKELKNSSESRIAEYFTSPNSYKIDRVRLVQAIEQTASEISKNNKTKLKLYTSVISLEKELIDQIIFNTFILRLLDSDQKQTTKQVFNQIKQKLFSIVEVAKYLPEGLCTFSVITSRLHSELKATNVRIHSQTKNKKPEQNKSNLSNELALNTTSGHLESQTDQHQTKENSLETALVKTNEVSSHKGDLSVDVDFLIYVIKAYAFNHHIIDADIFYVDVRSRQRLSSSWGPLEAVRRFLKLDLQLIGLSKKMLVSYGIEYNIRGSALFFSGTADHRIRDKTLVVQIVTKKGRILREIWIYGIDNEPEKTSLQEEAL